MMFAQIKKEKWIFKNIKKNSIGTSRQKQTHVEYEDCTIKNNVRATIWK